MNKPKTPPNAPLDSQKGAVGRFARYLVADVCGNTCEVTPEDFAHCTALAGPDPRATLLRQFVANELGHKEQRPGPPKHIEYMQRHELLDYCEVSEKGHYKWYPKGVLIQRLILDYASQLARDWGAFEMKNPLVLRADHNAVGQLMGEFHERDYKVDGGRGVCYLRYAADPLAFPSLQQVRFSRAHTPLKVYEETSCFRNEQEGEVSGLKRVRAFTMTDMHAACASREQAREEFEALCLRFALLMDDIIAKERWVLGWEGTAAFYEENREWLVSLGVRMKVPAFFKLTPEMTHYYAIKNEYQMITQDGSNIQVSTVQWDIKDGERFDIGYFDEQGVKRACPVIIHASSFGSIERALCAILESAAVDAESGVPPMFPLWLSPTQVRLVPLSDAHLEFALTACERLSAAGIRADVDDRSETVGKKVRGAEQEWVPYVLVVGPKEVTSGRFEVRCREDGKRRQMTLERLLRLVRRKTKGMPRRPLPLPQLLTRRPRF